MLNLERLFRAWVKRRVSAAEYRPEAAPKPPPTTRNTGVPREYLSLYTYLENRFANTVVLTFAQIEDLLGFALPDLARRHKEWWANADPDKAPSAQSRSWIQASRSATPNLLAQTVAFERAPA
jgi:hypothetical protein